LLVLYDITAAAPRAYKLGSDKIHMLEMRILNDAMLDVEEEVDAKTGFNR